MVRVLATQVVDVQRHAAVVDQTLEEFIEKIDIEIADAATGKLDIHFQAGTAGQVDHHARQRLVQRHITVAVTTNALLVAQGFCQRLAEGDADILHRVVRINVQVTLGMDIDIDQAVTRHLVEHVLEKRQTGIQLALAGAIQVDGDADLRLQRVAGHAGAALAHE